MSGSPVLALYRFTARLEYIATQSYTREKETVIERVVQLLITDFSGNKLCVQMPCCLRYPSFKIVLPTKHILKNVVTKIRLHACQFKNLENEIRIPNGEGTIPCNQAIYTASAYCFLYK